MLGGCMSIFAAGKTNIALAHARPARYLPRNPGCIGILLADAQKEVFPVARRRECERFDDREVGRLNPDPATRSARGVGAGPILRRRRMVPLNH